MTTRATNLRVGVLIVLGVVLLVAMVLFIAGGRLRQGRLIESYFRESVQGLTVGSPVKYRGVTLGEVTELGLTAAEYAPPAPAEFDRAQFQMVYVRYRIDISKIISAPTTQEVVQAGLRARLASAGLTGLAYIELNFVPGAPPPVTMPWTPVADVIPTVPSTFAQVQDAAAIIAQRLEKVDIEAMVNGIIGLTTDLRTQIDKGDLHQMLASGAAAMAGANEQIQRADLAGAVAQLRAASASLQHLLDSPDMARSLANADLATSRLAEASARLPALITSLQALVRHTDGQTADLTTELAPVLRDARAAAANLRDATEQLRRDPGQLLFGGPPPRSSEAR